VIPCFYSYPCISLMVRNLCEGNDLGHQSRLTSKGQTTIPVEVGTHRGLSRVTASTLRRRRNRGENFGQEQARRRSCAILGAPLEPEQASRGNKTRHWRPLHTDDERMSANGTRTAWERPVVGVDTMWLWYPLSVSDEPEQPRNAWRLIEKPHSDDRLVSLMWWLSWFGPAAAL